MTRDAAVAPSESPLTDGHDRTQNMAYRGTLNRSFSKPKFLADTRIA